MELHVWGTTDQLAILDANCLAAVWLMALAVPHDKFTVVTSSNTDLSTTSQLPALIHPEGQVDGYLDILRFAHSQGFTLAADRSLSKERSAINQGLLMYIGEKLQTITDYALYLNKDNYENYTRSIFSRYMPFPMQYNTPLHYRSRAKVNCARVGLNVEDKSEVEEEMLKQVPTVSKVQELKRDSMIEDKLVLKNSVTNMRCLNQLEQILAKIEQLKTELGGKQNNNNNFIFHTSTMTSSELLLLAHLYILTHKDLPDQFITSFVQRVQPQLLIKLESNLKSVQEAIATVQRRGPRFMESPNIFNAIRHFVS